MILSPGWSPCWAAGLPGWTAVTKMPLSLPPVNRIPTEPSFWKLMNRGSGLRNTGVHYVAGWRTFRRNNSNVDVKKGGIFWNTLQKVDFSRATFGLLLFAFGKVFLNYLYGSFI
jgi:hypothetical protein